MTWNERDSAESRRDFQELKSSPRREMCLATAHLIQENQSSYSMSHPQGNKSSAPGCASPVGKQFGAWR